MKLDAVDYELAPEHAPAEVCTECGAVRRRWPANTAPDDQPARLWCKECEADTFHEYQPHVRFPAEAAAMLAAIHLDGVPPIRRVEVGKNVVRAWVGSGGVSLENVSKDCRTRVAEVGPIEAYNTPTQEKAPAGTEAYVSFRVDGISDDYTGYALPTHAAGVGEATPKAAKDLSSDVLALARIAGIPGFEDAGD
jgi:hypothetical protein